MGYWAQLAPLTPPLSPPSSHPSSPWVFEKSLHMFMAHACGMTMDSPYKSQQDHGVFQILVSEDSCWQNDSGHIYFGRRVEPLSGKLISKNPLPAHTHIYTQRDRERERGEEGGQLNTRSFSVSSYAPSSKKGIHPRLRNHQWHFSSNGRFEITQMGVEKNIKKLVEGQEKWIECWMLVKTFFAVLHFKTFL